jgi:hypothetical protein
MSLVPCSFQYSHKFRNVDQIALLIFDFYIHLMTFSTIVSLTNCPLPTLLVADHNHLFLSLFLELSVAPVKSFPPAEPSSSILIVA